MTLSHPTSAGTPPTIPVLKLGYRTPHLIVFCWLISMFTWPSFAPPAPEPQSHAIPGLEPVSGPPRAIISTDKADYMPGATARIFGSGFLPREIVQLQVIHPDGRASTGPEFLPWFVPADANGA